MSKFTWNEANTEQLVALAGDKSAQVSQASLATIAEELGTTTRSVGSKLRKMDYDVQKASETNTSAWSETQEAELVDFVTANAGQLTYADIAASFEGGAFTAKQIQGKILSLELYGSVRKAEKVAAPRTYTEEQEQTFIKMAKEGAFLEDIAEAVGKDINSVRGKALSLTKVAGIEMPKQKHSKAKQRPDVLAGLNVEEMTVEQIVEATERTERGIKSMLSRRGISCVDYDGAAKRAKLDAKKED